MNKLSEEEIEAIWKLSSQGIDLEKLDKTIIDICEVLKPVIVLYEKNIETYLKYKK